MLELFYFLDIFKDDHESRKQDLPDNAGSYSTTIVDVSICGGSVSFVKDLSVSGNPSTRAVSPRFGVLSGGITFTGANRLMSVARCVRTIVESMRLTLIARNARQRIWANERRTRCSL